MENKDQISQTINHLFRQESGKMVAVLANIFGTEQLELAEDVVQDALMKALESWKYRGIPNNPKAWLYKTAKNKAIDIIRKNKLNTTFDFTDSERMLLTSEYTLASTMNNYWQDNHIKDQFLSMMFACCHPEISSENQITFILKSLCGFSTKEVARAFLTSEDTISKRIYRTKEYFRKKKIRPEIPKENELTAKTNTVLNAIYLMFNEGYNSTHSDQLIRVDLIEQCMFLGSALLENEKTKLPEVFALMALMCFHSSRSKGRLSQNGSLILLSDQDRSTWDRDMIELGNSYMNQSAFGNKLSTYHLEAAIAYEHCVANDYDSTNWKAILICYDSLLLINPDPVVSINRSMAVLKVYGAKKALEELDNTASKFGNKYYIYHAIRGKIYEELAFKDMAIDCYKKALSLTQSKQEKKFLNAKISAILN